MDIGASDRARAQTFVHLHKPLCTCTNLCAFAHIFVHFLNSGSLSPGAFSNLITLPETNNCVILLATVNIFCEK